MRRNEPSSHTLYHHFYPYKHPFVTSCGNYELGCGNPLGIMSATHHVPLPLAWRILKHLFQQKPSKYVYSPGVGVLSVPARQHFALLQSVYCRTCKLLWQAAKPLGSWLQELICYQCHLKLYSAKPITYRRVTAKPQKGYVSLDISMTPRVDFELLFPSHNNVRY